jgi:type II secretory pathway component PulF
MDLTLQWLATGLLWIFLGILPLAALWYLTYFLVSLPLRRQERARLFIDLIEHCLKQGQSVEQTITEIARSRDRSLGVSFHLLAAYIESGYSLDAAFKKAPRLLPPPIAAMLLVGRELGDLCKIIPACRHYLRDGVSQTWGALNYLFILVLLATPFNVLLLNSINIYAVPKFEMMIADLTGSNSISVGSGWFFPLGDIMSVLTILFLAISALVWLLAFFYLGGPRLSAWIQTGIYPVFDALAWRVPWRRKRLLRDFTAMLALLLDHDVPEEQALKSAAQSTANRVFRKKVDRAAARLRQGVPLIQALDQLDSSGEFRWRLDQSRRAGTGLMPAVRGWLESLDAKAFQQEQAAAQSFTTWIVLVNGLIIGLAVASILVPLQKIIQIAVLW